VKATPACRAICGERRLTRKIRRPHLRCATCLERRYYYGKLDRSEYTMVKSLEDYCFLNVPPVVDCRTGNVLYFLIVNMNGGKIKLALKQWVLRPLLFFIDWLNTKRCSHTTTERTGFKAHPNWGPMVIPHRCKLFYFYVRRGDKFIKHFFSLAEFFGNW